LHYFHKTRTQIKYKVMRNTHAKELIKEQEQELNKKRITIISPNNLTKVMRSNKILTDIQTYAECKEFFVKTHKELLHPGIENRTFQRKYYYSDY